MASEPTLYPNDVEVTGWVAELQRLLAEQGFPSSDPQGEFRDDTERAVRAFQEANGCDVDGIVGNQTWSALYGREREPEGKNNEPYGDTREGGAEGGGGGGGEGQEDVPAELVAIGAAPRLSDWTAEQRTAYFTGAGSEPRIEITGDDASEVEVLAIADTPDEEGEALA